jgi:pimeloyl-ACP methyl ester carboxylesterase
VLDLAAYHPQVIEAAVAHEPPVPKLLPEAGDYLANFDEIDRALVTQGWLAAFTLFQVKIGLLPPGRSEALTALLEPGKVFSPGRRRDLMTRISRNWAYMMTYEVRSFIDYEPDLARIADNRVRIVLGCGANTQDQMAIRMSVRTAELLGVACAEFSGGHMSPVEIPVTFARELRSLLDPA